jgi:hypothetical protein
MWRVHRVEVRWCEACKDQTAHEAALPRALAKPLHVLRSGLSRWLPRVRLFDVAPGECVRCVGRRLAHAHELRRKWLDGRTIIDPF